MNQALYAHRNNKRKMKKKKNTNAQSLHSACFLRAICAEIPKPG
jgi:hypothetical protein